LQYIKKYEGQTPEIVDAEAWRSGARKVSDAEVEM
jgi:hypothetical protein